MIKFPVRNKKNHGFSLLELIVVIAIIGVLLAIGTVAFSTAQQKSRDARRRGDMKAWQDALEQSFSTNQTYLEGTSCATENLNGITPSDPRNNGEYVYTARCDADSYCLCAHLEQAGTGNSTAQSSSPDSCSYSSAGGDYFCVSNLQ